MQASDITTISQSHPLDYSGLLSRLWFSWVNPFIEAAMKHHFHQPMHPNLPSIDKADYCFERIKAAQKSGKSAIGCLREVFGKRLAILTIYTLLDSLFFALTGKIYHYS